MVHQFTRWLRGMPVDRDTSLNLLARGVDCRLISARPSRPPAAKLAPAFDNFSPRTGELPLAISICWSFPARRSPARNSPVRSRSRSAGRETGWPSAPGRGRSGWPSTRMAVFPTSAGHIPRVTDATARCVLSAADAAFLAQTLPKLPCDDTYNHPLTVDLNGSIAIRAKTADQAQAHGGRAQRVVVVRGAGAVEHEPQVPGPRLEARLQ